METMTKSGGRLDTDSNEVTPLTTTTATGNGIGTPAVVSSKEQPAVATAGDSNSVQAIYRPLPDEDVNWKASKKSNSSPSNNVPLTAIKMGKQNGSTTDVNDGAEERMLKDEVKLSIVPSKDASEVQFRSENGDTKVNIEAVKECLSGMSKQELLKYANDPFWIKLRWFLFITFWLLWVAMLAGAIAIVVMAPKCNSPAPKKWWEESPIVRLNPSDTPARSLDGLETFLNILEEQHIQAISLGSILKETSRGHVEDFKDLNQQVGLIDNFKKFIKAAAEKNINVIMEIDPNHSSDKHPWFQKSIKREEPFTSYYVWANGTKNRESSELLPPNNWVSEKGGSAWEFNEERQQFYLHQFNVSQPEFNYNNPVVVNEFSEIFKYWLDLGVKGFVLSNTRYMVEDSKLRNDSLSSNYPAEAGSYQSLLHINTRDNAQNAVVLRQWRNVVANYTSGQGLFTLNEGIRHDILPLYNKEKVLIDLPQSLHFLSEIDPTNTAHQLNKSISDLLAFAHWPGIDLNGKGPSLRKRINANLADNLILMTMLLPATPFLNINDTISAKKPFAILAEARKNVAFHYGKTQTHVLNNATVFVYTRVKSGNPGYLVAFNTASQNTTIDVTGIPHVSEEVNILTHSQNYNEKLDSKKLPAHRIPLSSKSTLVVTFAPK
ncbi:neutral and basic amino acid transport protein rBAT isoform X2 [Copidosoma floridanum]|uniref:neutral and basic amino acid transport protein rBAT isoform X2 n=1 Tax=Copidosoma floridanum TaxID=29053 RepID=UPI0006C99024|nr:neutral and basic amino acid transport protein rBAT isoform X2 [Copidosoma floridanum]